MSEHINVHFREKKIKCKLMTKVYCNVMLYILITKFKIRINRGTGTSTGINGAT